MAIVGYLEKWAQHAMDWLVLFAGTWLASSILCISTLVLVYWALPNRTLARLSRFPSRVRGSVHFGVLGCTLGLAESFAAFMLLSRFEGHEASKLGTVLVLSIAAISCNILTWAVAGFVISPWLESKRYSLASHEAVAFIIRGVLTSRIPGILEVMIYPPVLAHPALSGLFKFSLAHLGPNLVVLIVAFAVHRAGIRRTISLGAQAT
jgi:hypothetical protein